MAFLYGLLHIILPNSVKEEIIGDLYELEYLFQNKNYSKGKILLILSNIGISSAFYLHLMELTSCLDSIKTGIELYIDQTLLWCEKVISCFAQSIVRKSLKILTAIIAFGDSIEERVVVFVTDLMLRGTKTLTKSLMSCAIILLFTISTGSATIYGRENFDDHEFFQTIKRKLTAR